MWKRLIAIGLFAAMLLVGAFGYAALKTPAAPSGPIQSVTLALDGSSSAVASSATLYEIQAGDSRATFQLGEVLNGQPNTVVGETDQVSGQIGLSLDQPQSAQVGTILVNARTLATDDAQRNRVIANVILATDQNEFISFKPTAISGLPASSAIGEPQNLTLTGQLTIRGVTREATFNATVTPVSATELDGTASTTVRFADWGINIPDVPFVAGVSDTAQLQLTFVAVAS